MFVSDGWGSPLPPLGFQGWNGSSGGFLCTAGMVRHGQTFPGGLGKMEHVGSYWEHWDVGTSHTGSEEGIAFHFKSRRKNGRKI